jgi:hypothetical protein
MADSTQICRAAAGIHRSGRSRAVTTAGPDHEERPPGSSSFRAESAPIISRANTRFHGLHS